MDGPVCLIVNPHAGAGRALRLLPGVEAALRGRAGRSGSQPTTSMQHARELAREACDGGEIVAAMGGDGIVGAVAGELRDGKGLLAVLPGGRGNDFARKLGIPFDPVEAVALLRARRRDAASTSPRPAARPTSGILSAGIDSDVSRIALETRLKLGTFVYTYGVLRAIASWREAASWTLTIDGEAADLRRLLRRGLQLRRLRRRDVPRARRAARRRPARRRDDRRASRSCRYLRGPAAGVQGHAPAGPRGHARAVPRGDLRGRAAVHGLRRRRPDRRPAGHGARAARARCGWWPRDDAPGRRCGRRQGGRHARAHGRPRRRDVAAGQGAHARRAARDRAAVAPPGPRQRRDQRHQRQDHDRGDGGHRSSSAPARGSSTTAPGRTWRAGSPARWRTPAAAAGAR